jgi:hypothetical protein
MTEWKKTQNALIDAKMNELAECKAQLTALRAAAEHTREQAWQEIEDWAMNAGFVLVAERARYMKNAAAHDEQVSK